MINRLVLEIARTTRITAVSWIDKIQKYMSNVLDFNHKSFLLRLCHTIQFGTNSNLTQMNIFLSVEFDTLHNVTGPLAFTSF